MTDREETRDPVKRGTVFVNHEALNTWLRFGTLTPLEGEHGYRRLEGAELLRWAGNSHVTIRLQSTKKE